MSRSASPAPTPEPDGERAPLGDRDPLRAADSGSERDPVEILAEDFLERRRRGESPTIEEYAERYREHAEKIRELFPAIAAVERLKASRERSSSDRTSPESTKIERLGDYRILREVGRGGMGVVFEAEQESLGRKVAVKVLPRSSLLDEVDVRRFRREASTAARLHHTNIVPVFGVGEDDGHHYYVMQFIEGTGLDALLDRSGGRDAKRRGDAESDAGAGSGSGEGGARADAPSEATTRQITPVAGAPKIDERRPIPPPASPPSSARAAASAPPSPVASPPLPPALSLDRAPWRTVAALGRQVADALAYAHAQGILHRDIKPGNLLLDSRGVVWVADFGLAKAVGHDALSEPGDVVGTLRYIAPEQFEGRADARSDIYSLGLTLYELATGRPAFEDSDRSRLIRKILHESPAPPRRLRPDLPRDLETVVLKAIARDPDHRYESAEELAEDLERFLEDRPVRARRISAPERLWRWARRNRAVASLSATALLLLLLVAVVASVGYVRTKKARDKLRIALDGESRERERAVATSDLALEALDRIFERFAPDRSLPSSDLTVVGEDGEEITVPGQPVLSPEVAALLEHLVGFYGRLAAQGRDDEKLGRKIAAAHRRVGDIRRRLGDLDAAEEAYERAIAAYVALLRANPEDDSLRIDAARAENELGSARRADDDMEGTRRAHHQALATLLALPERSKEKPSYRYELARTYYSLARGPGAGAGVGPPPPARGSRGPEGRGRPGPPGFPGRGRGGARIDHPGEPGAPSPREQARGSGGPGPPLAGGGPRLGPRFGPRFGPRRFFRGGPRGPFRPEGGTMRWVEKAVSILEPLVRQYPRTPDYRQLLARCQRELAARLLRQDPERGLEAAEKATKILEELVAGWPDVPDYRYDLAESYALPVAGELNAARNGADLLEVAEERLRKAVSLSEELVAEHPNIPEYAASQVRLRDLLARIQRSRGKSPEAEKELRAALALQESLVKRAPTSTTAQIWLARVRISLAETLSERGEHQEATRLLESTARDLEARTEAQPRMRHLRGICAVCQTSLAEAHERAGKSDLARAARERARALWSGR